MQAVIADFFGYFKSITDERKARPERDLATVIANGPDRRRADQRFRGHGLLCDRRHGRPRHHLLIHRRRGVGHVPIPRGLRRGQGRSRPSSRVWSTNSVRWITPVKHFMRSATEETEVRGRKSPRATG